MKKPTNSLTITLLLVCVSMFCIAQKKHLKGIVTTFDSIPLQGATIKIQSTKQVIQSDSLGAFTLLCEPEDKLRITADGFFNQTVKLSGNTRYAAINLKLKPGEKNKQHALGITSTSYHERLSALAELDSDAIDFSKYRTMKEAIEGRIAGVRFEGSNIVIRGNVSISGPAYALIVIDGVTSNAGALHVMNPAQVKSIDVIKDGSAAIYGGKAANGVVLVETKSGRDINK